MRVDGTCGTAQVPDVAVAPFGTAPVSSTCWFRPSAMASGYPVAAVPVAQRTEQRFSKPPVAGSNPAGDAQAIARSVSKPTRTIPFLGGHQRRAWRWNASRFVFSRGPREPRSTHPYHRFLVTRGTTMPHVSLTANPHRSTPDRTIETWRTRTSTRYFRVFHPGPFARNDCSSRPDLCVLRRLCSCDV